MSRPMVLAIGLVLLAACPHNKSVVIYRSMSEPGALQTCDANQQFHVEVKGGTEDAAKAAGAAQIRSEVAAHGGCGAYIFHDGAGKALDGSFNYAANYQLCRCK